MDKEQERLGELAGELSLHFDIEAISGTAAKRTSYFQLNYFILGREPTIQAKLNKCADELKSRKQMLDNARLEVEETRDHIELMECEIINVSGGDDLFGIDSSPNSNKIKEIKERQIKRKILYATKQLETIQQRIEAIEEECIFFVEAYKNLNKIEEHRNWDDDEVQLAYWSEKYAKEIKERLMMHMPVDVEVMRSILCLPDTAQIKKDVIKMITSIPEFNNKA